MLRFRKFRPAALVIPMVFRAKASRTRTCRSQAQDLLICPADLVKALAQVARKAYQETSRARVVAVEAGGLARVTDADRGVGPSSMPASPARQPPAHRARRVRVQLVRQR